MRNKTECLQLISKQTTQHCIWQSSVTQKNEKKIGLKFKDPALQMPLLEEELPKEGFPEMVPVVPWLCEYA